MQFFFVLAKNKRKFEEQATEELYTSSFEEIPENGSIADEIIQPYKKEELRCLTTEMKSTAMCQWVAEILSNCSRIFKKSLQLCQRKF